MEYISQKRVRANGRKVDLKPMTDAGIASLGMEEFRFQKQLCNENSTTCSFFFLIVFNSALVTYLLTYLLHGAESFLRSWPVLN